MEIEGTDAKFEELRAENEKLKRQVQELRIEIEVLERQREKDSRPRVTYKGVDSSDSY